MKNIIFTKSIPDIDLDIDGRTLIYYHNSYQLPKIKADIVEFNNIKDEKVKVYPANDYKNVIFIGTHKMINVTSRIYSNWGFLKNHYSQNTLYSIDTVPYINQLWRIIFNFTIINDSFGDYTYSFLLESHYNKYLEGLDTYNPLSLLNIGKNSKNKVQIDYKNYMETPEIITIPMDKYIHKIYKKEKEKLFENEDKISIIINKLSKFAAKICSNRKIPRINDLYKNKKVIIIKTDLAIDDYLTKLITEKVKETNQITNLYWRLQNDSI